MFGMLINSNLDWKRSTLSYVLWLGCVYGRGERLRMGVARVAHSMTSLPSSWYCQVVERMVAFYPENGHGWCLHLISISKVLRVTSTTTC